MNALPMTRASIAEAYRHMLAERAAAEAAVPGLQITDDGTIRRPTQHLVHCPQCPFRSSGLSQGRAWSGLMAHVRRVHPRAS